MVWNLSDTADNRAIHSCSLQIRFTDRVGFIADITTVLAENGYNIMSVDLHKSASFSTLYLSLNKSESGLTTSEIYETVLTVPDVLEVRTIERSPYEKHSELSLSFENVIGKSPSFIKAVELAKKFADKDSIISLRGESGTGKEVFARAIHSKSLKKGLFIPLNCAAMPEALLETELFGYVGGAFTGADKKGKPGLFEVADRGTIFLDEIAEMPLGMQAKLLRVVQDKKVRRIGSTKEKSIDVRIITATNRDIEEMVEEGRFREDLYFRINVLPVLIPSLNGRRDDIPLLAQYFLSDINAKRCEEVKVISDEALNKLQNHNYKGNVRELKNIIERASIMSDSDIIIPDDIIFASDLSTNFRAKKVSPDKPLKETMNDIERDIVYNALAEGLSIRQTAKKLGLSHVALINKIKKHKL